MSAGEMQACSARLYVDASFRRLFYAKPKVALSEYSLTQREKRSLEGLDSKMLEIYASGLLGTRIRTLERHFPTLFKLKIPKMMRFCERYHQLQQRRPEWSEADDAILFGAFIEESLASDDQVPPYAADLAKYLRLCQIAQNVARTELIPHHTREPIDLRRLSARPAVQGGVYWARFRYDVLRIEDDLRADRRPMHVHPEVQCVLIQVKEVSKKSQTFRIGVHAAVKS